MKIKTLGVILLQLTMAGGWAPAQSFRHSDISRVFLSFCLGSH